MSSIPANVASQIIDGSLPWTHSTRFHIDSFLQTYSLHDSNWISLLTNCGREDTTIAIIQFDPVWNPSISKPTSRVADWPLLFLRFNCVEMVELSGFTDIDGLGRGIANVVVDHPAEEIAITKIIDHFGASVSIRHFPLIDVLVLSSSGSIHDLSNHSA